jgi:hypothetical protein
VQKIPIRNEELHLKRTFTSRALITAVGVILGLAQPQSASAELVYVVAHNPADHLGTGDIFGKLNVSTGAFSEIGSLTTSNQTIAGMGFGPDRQLYGLGLRATPGLATDLFRINAATGAATDLGASNFHVSGAGSGSSGVLFGIDVLSNKLYAVTPPAPTGNFIATLPFSSDGLVAISPDGHLFAAGNSDGSFYRVDTTTGASTLVGNTGLGSDLFAGSFVGSTLYGFDGVTNAIVTIDPTTAATNPVATAALPAGYAVFASAAAPAVPEPSSLAVGAIGTLALLACPLWNRRRSREA